MLIWMIVVDSLKAGIESLTSGLTIAGKKGGIEDPPQAVESALGDPRPDRCDGGAAGSGHQECGPGVRAA